MSDGAWRLAASTPDAWAEVALGDVPALLSDHAHCELKAAASAMTLLKRNPRRPLLAARLLPLVREEAEHCQRVLRELSARDASLDYDLPSPYTAGLLSAARSRSGAGGAYLDALLASALIEMRSHERFERLAQCPSAGTLRGCYDALAEAEARHGALFLELAHEAHAEVTVRTRFDELARIESDVLAALPPGPRIHSGWAGL